MVDLPVPLPQTDRSTEIVPWPLWPRKALQKRTFLHRHQRSALATAGLYSRAVSSCNVALMVNKTLVERHIHLHPAFHTHSYCRFQMTFTSSSKVLLGVLNIFAKWYQQVYLQRRMTKNVGGGIKKLNCCYVNATEQPWPWQPLIECRAFLVMEGRSDPQSNTWMQGWEDK